MRLVRDSCWPKDSTPSSPRVKVSAFRATSQRRSECAPSRSATSCDSLGCTRFHSCAGGAVGGTETPPPGVAVPEPSMSHGASSYMSSCAEVSTPLWSGKKMTRCGSGMCSGAASCCAMASAICSDADSSAPSPRPASTTSTSRYWLASKRSRTPSFRNSVRKHRKSAGTACRCGAKLSGELKAVAAGAANSPPTHTHRCSHSCSSTAQASSSPSRPACSSSASMAWYSRGTAKAMLLRKALSLSASAASPASTVLLPSAARPASAVRLTVVQPGRCKADIATS